MNKFILLSLLLLCFSINAKAFITLDEMTSEYGLRNLRYSDSTIELVEITKTNFNGEPIEVEKENNWVRLYKYFDPAVDTKDFGLKQIRFYNTWE